VVVDRPLEDVFDYYAQYHRHPEWQPELLSAEFTTPGPVAAGSKGIEVRRLLGREIRVGYEITDHVRPHRSAFRTLDGPVRPIGIATFASAANGTRLQFELDLAARGPLRLLAPILALRLRSQIAAHLQRFKAVLESEGARP
jgi:uncharacterized membrane protein